MKVLKCKSSDSWRKILTEISKWSIHKNFKMISPMFSKIRLSDSMFPSKLCFTKPWFSVMKLRNIWKTTKLWCLKSFLMPLLTQEFHSSMNSEKNRTSNSWRSTLKNWKRYLSKRKLRTQAQKVESSSESSALNPWQLLKSNKWKKTLTLVLSIRELHQTLRPCSQRANRWGQCSTMTNGLISWTMSSHSKSMQNSKTLSIQKIGVFKMQSSKGALKCRWGPLKWKACQLYSSLNQNKWWSLLLQEWFRRCSQNQNKGQCRYWEDCLTFHKWKKKKTSLKFHRKLSQI